MTSGGLPRGRATRSAARPARGDGAGWTLRQLARGDQILAAPTLVRRLPRPVKKLIGDLSDVQRVLVGLDLRPAGGAARAPAAVEGAGA